MKKKLNKKILISMILPDRIEHPVGGMGVQAGYLIKHLQGDFDFGVHGFQDDTSLPYYHNVQGPLPAIRHHGLNTLTGQASYLASICEAAEKSGRKPDLIHTTDYTEYLAGILAAKVFNVPHVVSMQLSANLMHQAGLSNAREPQSPDGIAIERSMKEMELRGLNEADHIIQVSNVYKKFFSQLPDLDQKSTFIPNGVELEEWNKFEKVPLPGNGRRKVVYLGRLSAQKNVGALLQAHIPSDIDLIVVGDNTSDPALAALLAQKISVSANVHYLGQLFGQQKVNVLCSADAVIIPSLHECHPIVMHEAMASGSVVLHSGAGDMQEVLTDDVAINCGMTPASITSALRQFSEMDNKEIAQRKKRGLEVVQEYTWQKAAEATKKIYATLLCG